MRFDARRLVLAGAAVWSTGPVFLFLRAGSRPDFLGAYLPAAALLAIGIGIAFPLVSDAAVAVAPKGRYAGATALNGAIRQVGAAIGVAILAALLGSSRLASPHLYHAAWLFSAGCFAFVAVGSLALAPVQAPDFEEAEEVARRRAELSARARRPTVARPAPAAREPIAYVPDSDFELLSEVAMFASLPDDARQALAERAETIRLAGGDWLFHQGDDADALYIVRSGRLEVLLDAGGPAAERLVELGRGSVVGELALLCTERRAASG
jgi:NTE family protein